MKKKAKQKIIEVIERSDGVNGMDLVCRPEIAKYCAEFDFLALMDELVDGGDIVKLEYTLPKTPYTRVLYLPRGTKIVTSRK